MDTEDSQHIEETILTADSPSLRRKKRLSLKTRIIGALLLIACAFAVWQYGRQYHVVARIPCDYDLRVLASGFLTIDYKSVTYYDFHAKVLWRMYPDIYDQNLAMFDGGYNVSPNGHYLAYYDRHKQTISTWMDGRFIGSRSMSDGFAAGCWVLNDGRLVLSEHPYDIDRYRISIIRGSQMLAQRYDCYIDVLAPDGSVCFAKIWKGNKLQDRFFADLTIRKGLVYFDNKIITSTEYNSDDCILYSGGVINDRSGNLYRHGVIIGKSDLREHEALTPNGYYSIEHANQTVQPYSPVKRLLWKKPAAGGNGLIGYHLSDDGNVLCIQRTISSSEMISSTLASLKMTWLTKYMNKERYSDLKYLDVYTTPGRKIARYRIQPGQFTRNRSSEKTTWYPTPDQHTLLANVLTDSETKIHCTAVLLRRWW